jgi:metal-responsive CopG/Arc/MetJ family transcriptional regulator
MKVAVSIPNDVFKRAERLAVRNKTSRSRLYSEALREYIMRHARDEVTEAMNRVADGLSGDDRPFVDAAARRILESSEW